MKHKFILASASPRRRQLLEQIGADFEVAVSNAEENIDENIPPHILVQQLALLKGVDTAKKLRRGYIISADTVVVAEGHILGKPSGRDDAKRMLEMLSGSIHYVYTGICVTEAETGRAYTDYEKTEVTFVELTKEEIENYIDCGEPFDKAGAYGIQGKGAVFVSSINGDYGNVVGLPLCKLNTLIKNEFDINLC